MLEINAVDFAEIYSPNRFAELAGSVGLRAGFAVDLNIRAPHGGTWDLSRRYDIESLWRLIDKEKPELLIGSPPCTVFSTWRRLSDPKEGPENC